MTRQVGGEALLLAVLVATSGEVARTRSRSAKVATLAACLQQLPASLARPGVLLLAGESPSGRGGVCDPAAESGVARCGGDLDTPNGG